MDIDELEELVSLMRRGEVPMNYKIIGELSQKQQERRDEFEIDFLSLIRNL